MKPHLLIPVIAAAMLCSCGSDEPTGGGSSGSTKGGKTTTYTVGGVSFKMVTVDGGTFTMGATPEQIIDEDDAQDWPVHQVTLPGFSIGETEVTQALWMAVMGDNPSYFYQTNHIERQSRLEDVNYGSNLQRPVECVTMEDCEKFIARLNSLTGKNFRLPTEEEWEFAARGGNKSKGFTYAGSNTLQDVAWYWFTIPTQSADLDGYGTQSVATKSPNELGIYDMSGNVCEWCQSVGDSKIWRGGSWDSWADECRVGVRGQDYGRYSNTRGLRLVL